MRHEAVGQNNADLDLLCQLQYSAITFCLLILMLYFIDPGNLPSATSGIVTRFAHKGDYYNVHIGVTTGA